MCVLTVLGCSECIFMPRMLQFCWTLLLFYWMFFWTNKQTNKQNNVELNPMFEMILSINDFWKRQHKLQQWLTPEMVDKNWNNCFSKTMIVAAYANYDRIIKNTHLSFMIWQIPKSVCKLRSQQPATRMHDCHVKMKQKIWANAHETHESLWQFQFAANISLSPSISSHFTLLQPKIAQNH